ncbi:MAG: phosphoribosylformylglycinamidine synthase I [Planctomycetota bacterium]|nr:phosphoribosylformylglycinamidine synthase I [Planctomycetota bacterium]MEE2780875.1 phosphoribosylformylglycinamidine synthase I [Planctomycetota bacterium]
MSRPHALILRAPGTNCDRETAFALQTAGAETRILHVNRILENQKDLDEFQILCLPGGFSYGDDVAAGRILGNQIRHHLAEAMHKFRDAGKLILGICNGFQVLIKSGLLVGSQHVPESNDMAGTLTWNDSGKFEDRWVHLETCGNKSPFLEGIEKMYLPVAHAEGKFVTKSPDQLDALLAEGQLVLRYCDPAKSPEAPVTFPENPNGSVEATAGLCDHTGRVLGLMPHPERYIDRTQHPRWTRGEGGAEGDGLAMFKNAVSYFS